MTSNWQTLVAMDPRKERAERLSKSPDSFRGPIDIEPEAYKMARVYKNYECFKRDLSPESSKADYGNFLDTLTRNRNPFDSNISQTIEHNKRIIAYRNKEQVLRTMALRSNRD